MIIIKKFTMICFFSARKFFTLQLTIITTLIHFEAKKCDFFGGFTMIKTPQLEYTAITEALLKGDFTLRNAPKFASFGMRITKFT